MDYSRTFTFSSQITKRFSFTAMFPDRLKREIPTRPFELVRKVLASMQERVLSALDQEIPTDTAFENSFLESLARNVPLKCMISPELSKIFPKKLQDDNATMDDLLNQVNSSEGSLSDGFDFYLNGEARWGIELVLNGDRLSERLDKFAYPNGRYADLHVDDYVIVDLHVNLTGPVPSNLPIHSKLVTGYFKRGDYSKVHCCFGQDTLTETIELAKGVKEMDVF
jgi:hypothetical protein